MIPAERVLTEARSWMGTPWHHQARLKGVGVDCIGLVVGVCSALGLPLEDSKNYARYPDGVALAKELARQLVQRTGEPEPGDVMLFRISRMPQHVGICTPLGIIHAHQGCKRVVETAMSAQWRSHLIASYSIPGVAPWQS